MKINKKRFFLLESIIVIFVITLMGWKIIPIFLDAQNINTPENFPDPNFRKIIEQLMYMPPGGKFTEPDAEAYDKQLNISHRSIEYVTGIEFFLNITQLKAYNNNIKHNDLRNNTKITQLNIHSNRLTSLDLSACENIDGVFINGNKIHTLIIPESDTLRFIVANGNMLRTLNIPQCPNLKAINFSNNHLTSIDVSKAPNLTSLYCAQNVLSTIDLSNNPKLEQLNISSNIFYDLPNLSQNPNTGRIDIQLNQFTCEDLRDIQSLKHSLKQQNSFLDFQFSNQNNNINLNDCELRVNESGGR